MKDESAIFANHRSPLSFFALVLIFSLPFWLLGAITDLQLMPGLSVSALMTFCPVAAALILVHRDSGAAGVTELLWMSFDYKRMSAKRWYLLTLLTMPTVNLVVFALMSWMAMPLPAPQFSALAALLMFLAFFIGAVWSYNNAGKSVFAASLFHATFNLSFMLFPVAGSHFDMRLGSLVMAFAAASVTLLWGPTTLARYKCAWHQTCD